MTLRRFSLPADEISKLIGQIRFVAKASAEPKPKEPVKMGMIISGVLQRLESRILKRQATVTEPDSWPEVDGVADWLEFIWWEIFWKTRSSTPVKNTADQLNWQQEKNGFRFQVCDNGGGVYRWKPAPDYFSRSIPCPSIGWRPGFGSVHCAKAGGTSGRKLQA